MKKILASCLFLTPLLAAGCIAFSGEPAAPNGMISLSWESILIVYGPMAVWIVVLVRKDSQRQADDKEARKEWEQLLKDNTEVMTLVKETLAATKAESEKSRVATYRVIDEVRDMANDMKVMASDIKEVTAKIVDVNNAIMRSNTCVAAKE